MIIKNKNVRIFNIIIYPILISIFAYIYFTSRNEEKLLENFGQITTGKIVDIKTTKTRGKLFKYSFTVNHVVYSSGSSTSKNINTGEQYEVVYYSKNPHISKIDLEKSIVNAPNLSK